MRNLTPKVNAKYGAPMGRRTWNYHASPEMYHGKMYLRHIQLDNGGYDPGGAYWGIGQRLYGYSAAESILCGNCKGTGHTAEREHGCKACYGSGEIEDWCNGYIRREDAIGQVRAKYPECVFFGKDGYPENKPVERTEVSSNA